MVISGRASCPGGYAILEGAVPNLGIQGKQADKGRNKK